MTLIDDLVALATTPAPTFEEGPRLRWLERRLAGAPGELRRDRVGNLIWTWGDGPPRVVVAAHVDTVFPAPTPLRVERVCGDLVGPGIGDNAAAVAVAVTVVEELLTAGIPAPGAVAFTVGEEGLGNLAGATAVCEDLEVGAFIALEGHGLEEVIVDAVGSVRVHLQVTGPGGHSWVDRGAPSAITGLLEALGPLTALGTADAPVNVGTIAGGRSVNTIADAAECLIERRALDQAPLEAFTAAAGSLAVTPPLALAAEVVGNRPAGRLDRDAPLLRAVLDARAELGLPATLGAGSTDANAAIARGIPALCIGVAEGSGMHSLQERIDAASLERGAAQLRAVLGRLLR